MPDIDETEEVEAVARLLYETMVKRAQRDPDWSICGWKIQPQRLRDDWMAVALKAIWVARTA